MSDSTTNDQAARLAEMETVMKAIPPCPEHGHGCVRHALSWIQNARVVVEREDKLRELAADSSPANVQEFLEGQIRIVEAENEQIKRAGLNLLIHASDIVNLVGHVAGVEQIYSMLVEKVMKLKEESGDAVLAFGEALGVKNPRPGEKG